MAAEIYTGHAVQNWSSSLAVTSIDVKNVLTVNTTQVT